MSGGHLYGGIEQMLATFAATTSVHIEQQFALTAANRLSGELRDMNAHVVALPPARASRPLSVVTARRAFDRLLTELNPDAAIFHGSWTHAIFAEVARRRSCVLAFWQHAPIIDPGWPDRWASLIQPDVTIANSRFTALAPLFSRSSPHVIYCPVLPPLTLSASERAAAREQLQVRESDVVVLMAARLEAWKGHAVLIAAANRLKNTSAKFWIAGGVQRPSEQGYFEQLERAAAAGHSIAMLGQRRDVQRLMMLADVYCQPNTAPEPFGLAIAEAMSAGLPCVVSRSGGAAELIDSECGVLTAPGDTDAVAQAIERLAADRSRRVAMGTAARTRAEMLTDPAARVEQLVDALNQEPVCARAQTGAAIG